MLISRAAFFKNASEKLINVPVNLKKKVTQFNNRKWSTYFRARHNHAEDTI